MCGNAAYARDFFRHLGRRQQPAMAWPGTLAQLDFRHLYFIARGSFAKLHGIKIAVFVARSEITRSQFPHQVAAMFEVMVTQSPIAQAGGEQEV